MIKIIAATHIHKGLDEGKFDELLRSVMRIAVAQVYPPHFYAPPDTQALVSALLAKDADAVRAATPAFVDWQLFDIAHLKPYVHKKQRTEEAGKTRKLHNDERDQIIRQIGSCYGKALSNTDKARLIYRDWDDLIDVSCKRLSEKTIRVILGK